MTAFPLAMDTRPSATATDLPTMGTVVRSVLAMPTTAGRGVIDTGITIGERVKCPGFDEARAPR